MVPVSINRNHPYTASLVCHFCAGQSYSQPVFYYQRLFSVLGPEQGENRETNGFRRYPVNQSPFRIERFVDAFAFITSYKYGIWAVAMIWAGNWKGLPLVWQDWMLMVSHLAMTMEVFIYAKWMKFTWTGILLAGSWTLLNDYMDYHYGIFPSLFVLLHPYLSIIQWFTVALSITGIGLAVFVLFKAKKHQRGM